MAISDNRTSLDVFDATLATGDYVATSSASVDNEVFYQGNRSIAENVNDSLRAIMFNAGSPQDWSNNIFYLQVLCGVTGRLELKANGGFRIRFCGTATEDADFFEVYVGGRDSWPLSYAGGWTMFIVDVEKARAEAITNGWTNGTVPATNAIQMFGYAAVTVNMVRTNDNTWLNGLWRLPANTPGILIEGQSPDGPADYNFANVLSESETNFWGSFRQSDGGAYVCNVPIQIGNTFASATHGFTDQNAVVLWEAAEYFKKDLYGIQAIGGASNALDISLGVKTGTGASATGAQGVTIQSSSNDNRWYFDMSNTTIDSVGLYGCTFTNAGTMKFENSNVEIISSLFNNCTSANQSSGTQSAFWNRNTVVNANTGDGTAFIKTVNLSDILNSTFDFSDGHAIEITTLDAANTFTSVENTFIGYGANNTNDAALYNNSGNNITINVTGGTIPTFRNGAAGSNTVIVATVDITITGLKDNTEVRVYDSEDSTPPYFTPTELAGIEVATDGTTDEREFTFSAEPGTTVYIRVFNKNWIADDVTYLIPSTSQDLPVAQRRDRVFSNP